MRNHHDRLFVIHLEAAQSSLEFFLTANGSVWCYDTVLAEFPTKIINIQDGSDWFEKEESKERESSPTKRSRRDPEEKPHGIEVETGDRLETRPLGKI